MDDVMVRGCVDGQAGTGHAVYSCFFYWVERLISSWYIFDYSTAMRNSIVQTIAIMIASAFSCFFCEIRVPSQTGPQSRALSAYECPFALMGGRRRFLPVCFLLVGLVLLD